MDETTVVEEALKPGVFDVLAYVEQTAYPEKFVTLFRDINAAREYTELIAERQKLEDKQVGEATEISTDDLDARVDESRQKLEDSAMIFKLRGFAPGVVQEMLNQYNENDNDNKADSYLIARTIINVSNAKGEVDNHTWESDDVLKLKRFIAENEYMKLLAGVADVLFNAAAFDRAVDAGFSSGRSDMAPEL